MSVKSVKSVTSVKSGASGASGVAGVSVGSQVRGASAGKAVRLAGVGVTALALFAGAATVPASGAAAEPARAAAHAAPVSAPVAVPEKKAPKCSGENRPGRVVIVRGMPTATKRAARTLLGGAVRCDATALAKRAEKDRTRLTFGLLTPKQFFGLPEKEVRYRFIVDALVKTRPGYEKISKDYVWPRVAAGDGYLDPKAWDEAIAAGLITRAEADRSRREGMGYMGWRYSISEKGQWMSFVSGD